MFDLLRGLTTPAQIVGFARSIAEIAIIGAIGAVTVELASITDWGNFAIASPFIFMALRTGEGLADRIDPKKQRAS